jgi:hypothetical protein
MCGEKTDCLVWWPEPRLESTLTVVISLGLFSSVGAEVHVAESAVTVREGCTSAELH